MKQNDLGAAIGTSGDMLGKYERDEVTPSVETARKLAHALNVSLDYLLGEEDIYSMDKKDLERLKEISRLSDEDKQRIWFFVDMAIRDAKTRQAYLQ